MTASSRGVSPLETAYHHMTHRPLRGSWAERFGVSELTDSSLSRLTECVKSSRRFDKIMLFGQGGCGKSTLLYQLAADEELQHRRQIIHYSAADDLNLLDAEPVDLLFSIYMRFVGTLYGDKGDPPLFDFLDLVRPVLKSFSIHATGMPLLKEIAFRIKTDSGFRTALRNVLNQKIDALQELVGEASRRFSMKTHDGYVLNDRSVAALRKEEVSEKVLEKLTHQKGKEYKSEHLFLRMLDEQIGEVQALHYRDRILKHAWNEEPIDALLLIDDLDKINTESLETMMLDDSHLLTTLDAWIIMALPLCIYHSPRFYHLKDRVKTGFVRPAALSDMTGKIRPEALVRFGDMARRRLSGTEIDDQGLEFMIHCSGGVMRDFLSLLQDACKIALESGAEEISLDMVKTAVLDAVESTSRLFDFPNYRDPVRRIMKIKTVSRLNSKSLNYLLRYQYILEYGTWDASGWFDAHPFIKIAVNRDG